MSNCAADEARRRRDAKTSLERRNVRALDAIVYTREHSVLSFTLSFRRYRSDSIAEIETTTPFDFAAMKMIRRIYIISLVGRLQPSLLWRLMPTLGRRCACASEPKSLPEHIHLRLHIVGGACPLGCHQNLRWKYNDDESQCQCCVKLRQRGHLMIAPRQRSDIGPRRQFRPEYGRERETTAAAAANFSRLRTAATTNVMISVDKTPHLSTGIVLPDGRAVAAERAASNERSDASEPSLTYFGSRFAFSLPSIRTVKQNWKRSNLRAICASST